MKKQVTIHIGEIYGSAAPVEIRTLLGSCVAVCLFDPIRNIGAMNHILLPGRADLKQFNAPARFSINAMELLINKMLTLGADRHRIIAKVFGGAHMLPQISTENGAGRRIAAFVMDFLRNESIELVSHDLGGRLGRQVHFHTDTGDVFVRRVQPAQNRILWAEEEKAIPRVRREVRKSGAITLFDSSGGK
ncbi:MAG: chemotaxis protein CheD [Pseudomonadota bacterium]